MQINKYSLFNLLLFGLVIAPFGVGIPLNIGFKTLDVPKIVTFLMLILFLTHVQKGLRSSRMTMWFGIFVFLHFLSAFYAFEVMSSLVVQIGFTLLYYSGFYLMVGFIRDGITLNKVINSIKYGYLLLMVFALIEFLLGYNPLDRFRTAYLLQEFTRFNSELGLLRGFKSSMGNYSSNLPFAYLMASLFFLYLIPSFKNKVQNKRYTQINFLLGIPALLTTQSRAMYIAFAGVLLISFLVRSKISFQRRVILMVAFPIVLFGTYKSIEGTRYGDFVDTYLLNITVEKTGDEGLIQRFNYNLIDFNFAMESPVLGHGSGMLVNSKRNQGRVTLESKDSSYLMTILADRGLISFVLFMFILFVILKRMYKLGKVKWKYRAHCEAIFYALLVFTICLNSSQREESQFFYYALLGIGVRLIDFYAFEKKHGINNSPNL